MRTATPLFGRELKIPLREKAAWSKNKWEGEQNEIIR
jgi:hypothetical protein